MKNLCHKCLYNGKNNDICLSCVSFDNKEDYNYRYQRYLFENQPNKSIIKEIEDEKITKLDEEIEEKLKFMLISIFNDLTMMEILTLQGIIQEKSLTTIAKEIETMIKKNNKEQTRFHIFQLRKSIGKKIPSLKNALLTFGQRKKIK